MEIKSKAYCFRKKLIPWLESQGVKIEEKNWDY